MEENLSLPHRLLNLIRGNLLVSGLFFVGFVALVIGLIQYFYSTPESVEFVSSSQVETVEAKSVEESSIFVDVSGAVRNPGLYKLDSDARVQDALNKAGGITSEADSDYIAMHLNLASKLSDGVKIYIPTTGEEGLLPSANIVQSNQDIHSSVSNGLISINSASSIELEQLPGIGPATASKIIESRPYASVQELLEKKAVGNATFQKIKDLVSL